MINNLTKTIFVQIHNHPSIMQTQKPEGSVSNIFYEIKKKKCYKRLFKIE